MTPARPRDAVEAAARAPREILSTLVDGECTTDATDDAVRRWRRDEVLQRDWHLYHLIGDALRSDELATDRPRDHALLQAVRARLANEPVPVAPQPLTSASSRRWWSSVAVAAGFAAVGATVFVLQPPVTGDAGWSGSTVAVQPPADGMVHRVGHGPDAGASGPSLVLDGQVIRDARLDAYFEAHRGALGPVSAATPGGALRSVEILVPRR